MQFCKPMQGLQAFPHSATLQWQLGARPGRSSVSMAMRLDEDECYRTYRINQPYTHFALWTHERLLDSAQWRTLLAPATCTRRYRNCPDEPLQQHAAASHGHVVAACAPSAPCLRRLPPEYRSLPYWQHPQTAMGARAATLSLARCLERSTAL